MKVKIQKKKDIMRVVENAYKISSRYKSPCGEMSLLLVSAKNNQMKIVSYNSTSFLKERGAADVLDAGVFLVNCKKFYEIIREAPDDSCITISSSETRITISYSNSCFVFPLLPLSNFPSFDVDKQKENRTEMEGAGLFLDMLSRVSFAASRDEARPNITGVLVTYADRYVEMAATDGYRVAVVRDKASSLALSNGFKAILPISEIDEIKRFLSAYHHISIMVKDGYVIFYGDNKNVLSVRLVDELFPKYKLFIPSDFKEDVVINKLVLFESLKRVSILSQGDILKRISVNIKDDKMTISSTNDENDIGNASSVVLVSRAAEVLQDLKRRVSFFVNLRFLKEPLSETVKGDTVRLRLSSDDQLLALTSDDNILDWTYVMALMR